MTSGDYIFKRTPLGLKYIGDFDGLYKNDIDPWGQKNNDIYVKRRLLLLNTLLDLNPLNVLDVGAGLGHATQLIRILITQDVLGIDISKVAVEKASKLFPDVDFKVMDIRKEFPKETYTAIVLNNILLYILADFKSIVLKAEKHLSSQGYLIIPQAFIKNQQFGTDVIDGYEGLIKFLHNPKIMDKYKLVRTEHLDPGTMKTDSITVLQKRR